MGGDYGFSWNPHGDYAKELSFFVNYVGFGTLDTIKCEQKPAPRLWDWRMRSGHWRPGKLADILVVDGDVVADIRILEDRSKFIAVMQGGLVKAGQLAGRTVGR